MAKKLYDCSVKVILIVSTILLSSCASTHFIEHDESSYAALNNQLIGKKVTIILSSEIITGGDVTVSLDSTYWTEPKQKIRINVPTREVNEIIVQNRDKGAIKGFLIGSVTGFIVVGALLLPSDPAEWGEDEAEDWGAFLAFCGIGAAICASLGLLSGYTTGAPDKYVLKVPDKR